MSRFSRRGVLAALTALLAMPRNLAASEAVAKRVALQGYDPVAYFTKGRPEKGSAEFAASFDGATYWFSNDEHRTRFVTDPDRYAPQFGGFCAINIARGEKYEADPEAWVIADGKLYVFGAKEGVPIFRQQAPGIIAEAKQHWPEMRRTQ
jgi:YHS domain-containing protein